VGGSATPSFISDDDTLNGGSGDDLIYGDAFGPESDHPYTSGGNDWIFGGAGDDVAFGGRGADEIHGEDGNDALYGESGDDDLTGGAGLDALFGGVGNDRLFGEAGDDALFGEDGSDFVDGGLGNDYLDGGAEIDFLYAGEGNDYVYGGAGNDQAFGDAGEDVLHGGSGNDWLMGGDGSDRLFGDAGSDDLSGGAGSDSLAGGTGADALSGGSGADIFRFSAADVVRRGTRLDFHETVDMDSIGDFTGAEGDRIDLGSLLDAVTDFSGTTAAAAISQGYLHFLQSGADTIVYLDRNGSGSDLPGSGDIAVVRLAGVSAADLGAENFLVGASTLPTGNTGPLVSATLFFS
jgi:Ca2+-binding RTX toxin-like protein